MGSMWRIESHKPGATSFLTGSNFLIQRGKSHAHTVLPAQEFTGPLEGTNNKIKTLQKQAYGFWDLDFFILKIYGLHKTKFALVG